MPDPRADEPLNVGTRAEPRKPTTPGSGLATPTRGTRRYRVEECPAHAPYPPDHARMVESARPLIAALSRIAWDTDRPDECDRGQEAGSIDEGAMHRLAAYGDPRVFERPQEQNRATVAVHVLIDCSGSMGASVRSDETESRIGASRTVGYALATAFGRNPRYRVAVSGHDVAYGGNPRVRFHRCKDANAIAGLRAGGDNADGYAIEHAFRLVERERADRRIVFLIADGQPAAEGYGYAGKHIQSVIGAAASRGMDFLAVGIEGTIRPTTGRDLFGSRFVNLDATRSAGPLLARVIARMARGSQP
jgi:Mg-chelatase subunit ChlD